MHGDNTPDQIGAYGTKGVPNAGNKPPARYEAAEWTDQLGNSGCLVVMKQQPIIGMMTYGNIIR